MPELSKRAQVGVILCLVLLLRLPFLNGAIQGDDFYYLKGAEHAQIDPLHPTHARYVFLGEMVDMRGHPHPPLNAWYLALLIRVFGGEREIPLHAAYILFSLLAAMSAWVIAQRFGKRPLLATVLFLVTPAFVVNGNSLESDLPFVAFWLAAIGAFVYGRWWLAGLCSVLAALAAYQAVVLTPVLAWYLWTERRRDKAAWAVVFAAPATIVAWQLFERLSSGALPATVLAGYMQSYNLQAFTQKLKNAGALTGHLAWLVFPALSLFIASRTALLIGAVAAVAAIWWDPLAALWIGIGVAALVTCGMRAARREFLAGWIVIFFAAALAIFFAGSARYLLPIVLPLSILVADRVSRKWLIAGAAAEAVLSAGLAVVNYQHWNGYREFARSVSNAIPRNRMWTNAEWGLRHYLEINGAMPVENGRAFWPGDLIVTSAYAAAPNAPATTLVAEQTITSAIPLRIVALGADSAYSSIAFGLAPFAFSTKPMDQVHGLLVADVTPELSTLTIGTPEAAKQIVSGIYNNDRWTAGRATVVLKRPAAATTLFADIFIPPQSPAREVALSVDGKRLKQARFNTPGAYTIEAPAPNRTDAATVTLEVDKTFSVPPDQRQLGVLLIKAGLR